MHKNAVKDNGSWAKIASKWVTQRKKTKMRREEVKDSGREDNAVAREQRRYVDSVVDKATVTPLLQSYKTRYFL
jgi:hypothetical protein